MHVRITTVSGASNIDRGIDVIREDVLPRVREQHGFRGLSVSGDRSTGVVNVLSQWETEADLDASESVADKARIDTLSVIGGQTSVARYEQLLWEAVTPASPGAKLQIRDIKMDPQAIDDNLTFFKESVLPAMKSTAGFLAVRNLMNRATGEGRVGSVWADDASVQAWLAQTDERRVRAAERGVEFGNDQVLEVLFAAMS
jgi:heme-degrading monooxygenase HmoA